MEGSPPPERDSAALNAARKRRGALREAIVGVEYAASSPAGTGLVWWENVDRELHGLRKALSAHIIEVEAPGGLLAEVSRVAPRLISAVERIKDEHAELCESVDAALDAVMRQETYAHAEEIPAAREALLGLLGRLVRHRQAGADLIYDAYAMDIGGLE